MLNPTTFPHPPDGDPEPAPNRRFGGLSSRRVHLAKTITWRVIATFTTVVISYWVTGSLAVGATIGGIEATAKMALYYGHERAWARLVPAVG
ncbi:MAG: DUF2061 domain-containing protein [Actinobacteria bacterium]|nr:DUF2061 domain-containing protein [Actinomycetota bacterium]